MKSKKLKLREEARAVFLQRKSRELVDNDELQKLWFLLEGNKSGEPVNDEAMITFTNFQKVWLIYNDSLIMTHFRLVTYQILNAPAFLQLELFSNFIKECHSSQLLMPYESYGMTHFSDSFYKGYLNE